MEKVKTRTKLWVVLLFGMLAPFIWSNFSFATVGKPMIVYSENMVIPHVKRTLAP